MKKALLLSIILLTTFAAWAQVPQQISYQSVIRDGNNKVIASSTVGIKISLLQGSSTGPAVYVETHRKSTNANGLVSLEIGTGTVLLGSFASINWANGPYLVKTETDPTGGTNYSAPGVFALNSVPYALYAANGTPGPKGDKGDTGATGLQGIQGATGATGATGVAGANGKTVSNGTSNPVLGTGVNGDFYINTATNTLFGPKANGAWPSGVSLVGPTGATGAQGLQGATGATGVAGADGKTIRNGTSDPVSGTGVDGDFYINTASNTLFGPKANGAWPSGVSLVGPTGATGAQGIQGATGATGAVGPRGDTGDTGPQGPIGLPGQAATTPNLAAVLANNNSANSLQIKNLANPTEAQDAVTKQYVDLLQAQITELQNLTTFPVPQNGLVAWYPFNGNVNDESGNNNVLESFGITSTTDRSGNSNAAYSFSNTQTNVTHYLKAVNRAPFATANYSISAWFNTSQFYPSIQGVTYNYQAIVFHSPESYTFGPAYGLRLNQPNNSILEGNQWGTTGQPLFSQDGSISTNQWYHAALTYDGTTMKMYLNGQLVGSRAATLSYTNQVQFLIGGAGDGPFPGGIYGGFNGKLDDIGFWNRALTEDEILKIYQGKRF
ncbi:MAG: hypothetical protein LW824_21120 [Algoriphagus sp.]|nr:hypothetical protein [Algoriphagus sp.]